MQSKLEDKESHLLFCDQLFQRVKPIWDRSHAHPFVQGIGLIEYAKLFALGAVKASDVQTMGEFAKLLNSTLNVEMDLHRQYAQRFSISKEELEQAQPAPVTLAYSHYMLHVAQNGTLAELVSALLPCMWSYWEIGKELSHIPGAKENELYGEWVEMYSSTEFGELSLWLINLLNQLAQGKSESELEKLTEIFLNTSRFEYMFWDMAYNEEMWPTDE